MGEWIRVLTLLAIIIGLAAVLSLLWSRRTHLFRPQKYREQELSFRAATEIMEKVILDFVYVHTHQVVDDQLELTSMSERLSEYSTRPFLGSDLRAEMIKLRRLVGEKIAQDADRQPLGESAWPEGNIRWTRADASIIEQYLAILAKTIEQLKISPSFYNDIKERLVNLKRELELIEAPAA